MNFEERKAEIFRRANGRIAAKKRKKRIILGAVVPVLLVAVLAFPVSRLLGSAKGEEKSTAILMENQPSIAPGEHPAPHATYPEISPDSSLQSNESPTFRDDPLNTDLDILYHLPPDVYLYSLDKEKLLLVPYSGSWTYEQSGQNFTVDFSPAVSKIEMDTCCGYLILDVSCLVPRQVYGSVTDSGKASALNIQALTSEEDVGYLGYIPESNFSFTSYSMASYLYLIELKPGENLYSIVIDWPNGSMRYDFTVNYKE